MIRFQRKTPIILSLITGIILSTLSCSSTDLTNKPGGLKVGDKMADFALLNQYAHIMKLTDVPSGWYLVIILYRGYWCNPCRDMLFKLKDDFPKFAPLHAVLAAVSTDSVEVSANINQQWQFPFPLLSDPQLNLITALGAQQLKGHGIHDIARPAVVIVDPKKIIRFKIIGQNPPDLPTDNEILFNLQQMELHSSM